MGFWTYWSGCRAKSLECVTWTSVGMAFLFIQEAFTKHLLSAQYGGIPEKVKTVLPRSLQVWEGESTKVSHSSEWVPLNAQSAEQTWGFGEHRAGRRVWAACLGGFLQEEGLGEAGAGSRSPQGEEASSPGTRCPVTRSLEPRVTAERLGFKRPQWRTADSISAVLQRKNQVSAGLCEPTTVWQWEELGWLPMKRTAYFPCLKMKVIFRKSSALSFKILSNLELGWLDLADRNKTPVKFKFQIGWVIFWFTYVPSIAR